MVFVGARIKKSADKRRWVAVVAGCGVVAVLWALFPPFHVVSLKGERVAAGMKGASAEEFARGFWKEKLLAKVKEAPEAGVVLAGVRMDLKAGRAKFGRTEGMGGATYVFVRGTGKVVKVEGSRIFLKTEGAAAGSEAEVVISTGFIFGNALRDGTGLVKAGDFENSQGFNEVSAGLNKIAEREVLAGLREKGVVGAEVEFGGVCEIGEDEEKVEVLRVVPVMAVVR